MSNIYTLYENVISDLCRTVGISPASDVVDSGHLAIGDQLIGLDPDLESEIPTLSVYLEAGETHPSRDAAMYERMLVWNINSPPEALGHYGLHPYNRHAVFCIRFRLDHVDGAELAATLATQMQVADDSLRMLALAA